MTASTRLRFHEESLSHERTNELSSPSVSVSGPAEAMDSDESGRSVMTHSAESISDQKDIWDMSKLHTFTSLMNVSSQIRT